MFEISELPGIDELVLDRDHIDILGEFAQCFQVSPVTLTALRHGMFDRTGCRRVKHADAHAQLGRGPGQHELKLASAENADGDKTRVGGVYEYAVHDLGHIVLVKKFN